MNCAICKSVKLRENQKQGRYTLQGCDNCKIEFWTPLEHPGEQFYETSDLHEIKGKRELQWRHKQFLSNPLLKKGTLLDIGCGTGEFLYQCKKKGFEVWGIDIALRNIQEIKERYNISTTHQGTVKSFLAQNQNQKFDIVTFFEIVEHLADPIDFFNDVRKLLKPNGYIVMSVPNSDRFGGLKEREENPPNHLFRWREASLKFFLAQEYFQDIKIRRQKITSEFFLVRGCFSFGIAKKILKKNEISKQDNQVAQQRKIRKIVSTITRYKNSVSVVVGGILAFPLRLWGIRYWDMYATARINSDKTK